MSLKLFFVIFPAKILFTTMELKSVKSILSRPYVGRRTELACASPYYGPIGLTFKN